MASDQEIQAVGRWGERHGHLLDKLAQAHAAIAAAGKAAESDRSAAALRRIHAAADQLGAAVSAVSTVLPIGAASIDGPYRQAMQHYSEGVRLTKAVQQLTSPADAIALNRANAELGQGTAFTHQAIAAVAAMLQQRAHDH